METRLWNWCFAITCTVLIAVVFSTIQYLVPQYTPVFAPPPPIPDNLVITFFACLALIGVLMYRFPYDYNETGT